MPLPEFKPVEKSSNIAATVHHDGALFVQFKNGAVWKYAGVPAETHKAMIEAPSVGSYFASKIKGKFAGAVVPAEPVAKKA